MSTRDGLIDLLIFHITNKDNQSVFLTFEMFKYLNISLKEIQTSDIEEVALLNYDPDIFQILMQNHISMHQNMYVIGFQKHTPKFIDTLFMAKYPIMSDNVPQSVYIINTLLDTDYPIPHNVIPNILHWLIFHLNTSLFIKVVTKTDIKFTQHIIDDIAEHISRCGNKEMMRAFVNKK